MAKKRDRGSVATASSAVGRLTRYEADVLKAAKANHIWVNAFATIRPSDELALQIGRIVLRMLRDEDACIQADYDEFETLKDLRKPELIVRVNRS